MDLKGFGEVSHLLEPFLEKLKKTGLSNKLSEDLTFTLTMFEKIGKKSS